VGCYYLVLCESFDCHWDHQLLATIATGLKFRTRSIRD